jgi:hypothetical protein
MGSTGVGNVKVRERARAARLNAYADVRAREEQIERRIGDFIEATDGQNAADEARPEAGAA